MVAKDLGRRMGTSSNRHKVGSKNILELASGDGYTTLDILKNKGD